MSKTAGSEEILAKEYQNILTLPCLTKSIEREPDYKEETSLEVDNVLSQNDSMLDIFKNKQVRGMYGEKKVEDKLEDRGHSTLEKVPLNQLNEFTSKHNLLN